MWMLILSLKKEMHSKVVVVVFKVVSSPLKKHNNSNT